MKTRWVKKLVYFFYDSNNIKIGYTKNLNARRKALQTSNPNRLVILGYINGDKNKEKELHQKFNYLRVQGEWFMPKQELIDYINENNLLMVYIDWLKDKLQIYKKMKAMCR